jgi:hypothetical protein
MGTFSDDVRHSALSCVVARGAHGCLRCKLNAILASDCWKKGYVVARLAVHIRVLYLFRLPPAVSDPGAVRKTRRQRAAGCCGEQFDWGRVHGWPGQEAAAYCAMLKEQLLVYHQLASCLCVSVKMA